MRQAYNTDLSNEEWEIIAPMLPKPSKLWIVQVVVVLMVVKRLRVANASSWLIHWVKDNFRCTWEVSTRDKTQKGFVVESKRWVVERTFAWIGKYRKLSKECEFYENTSESFIYLALLRKMLRNLAAINS